MTSFLNPPKIVAHFTMGGTIEGDPSKTKLIKDPVTGKNTTQVSPFEESQTAKFLPRTFPDIIFTHHPICNVDSKDIKGADIGELTQQLLEMERLPESERPDRYIVTIGTDRAVSVGIILMTAMEGILTRPLVMTASFVPLADTKHAHPDAPDNLRGAVITPIDSPGFYIKMGEIFDRVDRVMKDFDKEIFYRVKGFTACQPDSATARHASATPTPRAQRKK